MSSPSNFEKFLVSLVQYSETWNWIPTVISMVINLFHVFILSRKSISSSAVNCILLGIGVVDIISPIYYLRQAIDNFYEDQKCPLPCTHTEIILDWVFGAIRENFRRCSVWLGLSLTVIRTVSVKMAANKTFDFVNSAKTGRYSIFIVVLVSSGFSIGYLMRYHIVKSTVAFVPDEGCPELDSDLRYPYQIVELSKTNSFLIGSARQIHLVSTAIFGKILPSILFPISALILILELRKTRRMQTGNKKISDKNNRLVVYMTISFIVIELPIGICKLVTMTEETYEDSIIPESIVELLNVIYVSMTTTHFFICFAMSSQYRNTVKGVLRIPTKVSRRMFSQFSSSER